MRIARQQQIRNELERALDTYDHALTHPSRDFARDAAATLAQAARNLLHELAEHDSDEPGFRVRMRGYTEDPFDCYLQAIPAGGDIINTAEGTLRVNEVAWNFDPRIPADVILFLITPEEEAAQRFEYDGDDPMCDGCKRTYGEHCSDELECPIPGAPGEFSDVMRFRA